METIFVTVVVLQDNRHMSQSLVAKQQSLLLPKLKNKHIKSKLQYQNAIIDCVEFYF